MKGQASTEFLALMAIGIAMLSVSMIIYSFYSNAAGNAQRVLEAEGLCQEVASFFGAVSALGDGANATFSFPKPYAGGNYTVWMVGGRSLVKVDYDLAGKRLGVGCRFPSANVTDGSASTFVLKKDFMLKNNGGVIEVVQ